MTTSTACKLVLVVEDNEATREAFDLILASSGYQVLSAENGLAALEALRGPELPCVIVLDLMMPVMDGYQFREAQRKDSRVAGIPVIVCSASGDARRRSQALQADAYLDKPVEVEQLLALVERYC